VFARRAPWDLTPNRLAAALASRRARGLGVLDLTESNPTRCGLVEPAAALREALAVLARDPRAPRYEPDPRGDPAARAALAEWLGREGAPVEAGDLVLTAGTSEGYAHLFRLLAEPGDRVHLPSPGYPLFEHLAALEGVEAARYALRPPRDPAATRWRVGLDELVGALDARSRAIVLIHPHNPTGSWLDPEDLAALRGVALERGLALVCDEVFLGAALDGPAPPTTLAGAQDGPLHFVLSGASKRLGLPQLKIAWIAACGADREEALARLEFVADAYLSVSPLLAGMLPALLAHEPAIARALRERVARNRAALAAALAGSARATLLPAEAGWAAIVRVHGEPVDEEDLVLELLERRGVLVQPGFLFDLEPESGAGHLVLGCLPEPESFARGAGELAASLQ
jgi:aspartate/methionine/tyrosine aminotransferase